MHLNEIKFVKRKKIGDFKLSHYRNKERDMNFNLQNKKKRKKLEEVAKMNFQVSVI